MSKPRTSRRSKFGLWVAAGVAALLIIAAITVGIIAARATPILRNRVVNALADSYNAHVDLDRFSVSSMRGLEVTGEGLRITPHGLENYPPEIQVHDFHYHLRLTDLFRPHDHIRSVVINGYTLTLAPKAAQDSIPPTSHDFSVNHGGLVAEAFHFNNAKIVVLNGDPSKPDMVFDIPHADIVPPKGLGKLEYTGEILNPVPKGIIRAHGTVGPWSDSSPQTTPVTGDFTFNDVDLGSVGGIGGTLSSHGHFEGPLNHLTVDGETSTPNFRTREAGHPIALNTKFHAVVDGTTGSTALDPVDARLGRTHIICRGTILTVKDKGNKIDLDAEVPSGRAEDLLTVLEHSMPPTITGDLRLKMHFQLAPGKNASTVSERMHITGSGEIQHAAWGNKNTDKTIDAGSLRIEGDRDRANSITPEEAQRDLASKSAFSGSFRVEDGIIYLEKGIYTAPGIHSTMTAQLSLKGDKLHLDGVAQLDAPVSDTQKGFKRVVLKPIDPLFKKQGKPAVVEFHADGPGHDPQFKVQAGKFDIPVSGGK